MTATVKLPEGSGSECSGFERGLDNGDALVLTELDERVGDGLVVTLLWDADSNEIYVRTVDLKDGGAAVWRRANPDQARLVFEHPFGFGEIDLGRSVIVR